LMSFVVATLYQVRVTCSLTFLWLFGMLQHVSFLPLP
jgi:hypothetical protein